MVRASAGKGAKRVAKEVDTLVENKRSKVDPVLSPVTETLEASPLPDSCRAMLLAALPSSLSVASDLRSKAQERVVEMTAEVMDVAKGRLQSILDEAEANLMAAMASKEELVRKFHEADAAVTAAKDTAASKQAALAEAQMTFQAACAALRNAKDMQKEGDVPLEVCEARRSEVKAAVEALQAETIYEHPDTLMQVMRNCDASESLLASMPSILALIPSERSGFQNVVVTEARKLLNDRIAEQTAFLDASGEDQHRRAAAVEEAERAQQTSKAILDQIRDENLDAEVEEQNAVESLRVAREAADGFDPQLAHAALSQKHARANLDHFLEHNFKTFDRLRSNVSTEASAFQAGA